MFFSTLFVVLGLLCAFGPSAVVHAFPTPLQPVLSSITSRSSPQQISAFLDAHNVIRAAHNATALQWSPSLAQKAEFWANQCHFKHTDGVLSNDFTAKISSQELVFFLSMLQ
ncbi:hypothetical protein BJ912DRAFT_7230 [Pholiota molesta]|nr:hypothetical protein BJ912DRAFT_7230 [Pholiota molesta]